MFNIKILECTDLSFTLRFDSDKNTTLTLTSFEEHYTNGTVKEFLGVHKVFLNESNNHCHIRTYEHIKGKCTDYSFTRFHLHNQCTQEFFDYTIDLINKNVFAKKQPPRFRDDCY